MPGTVTIVAAPPTLGRAGRLKVEVNSVKVGKVRQGASLELTLNPGVHRFRVSGGGWRSKAIVLSVTEEGRQQLFTGIHFGARVLSVMGFLTVMYIGGILAAALAIALVAAIPGSYLYLRPTAMSPSAEALEDAEEAAAAATSGEPWWVNDPNLAKRYRNG